MSTTDSTADEIPVGEYPAGTDVALIVPPHAGAIIHAEHPDEILAKASQIATSLAGLIESQGLAVNVGGKRKHVEVGGWQALGTMLGALGGQPLHAETVWTRKVAGPEGQATDAPEDYWEAKVEIRTPDGTIVGSAEAMCSRTEKTWKSREDFALRSMAETRAESRAYRRAAGWIVHIAGFSPTPAEEMGHTPGDQPRDDAPSWTDPASDGAKRSMLAALEHHMGHVTAVEYAQALAMATGGHVPDVVAQWVGAMPAFIAAGLERSQAAPPAAVADPEATS